ncbi:hypothetical protein RhiLY_04869 [Ceratobasidium sp. AG-Ba]|nr:hypothetical protein RhiLY_04869 [Ceratobasidium sp. AG-Ba]
MHARVALFTSSCYWAPTPLDIPSHVLESALPTLLYGPPTPLQDILLSANATASTNTSTPHVTYSARLERPKRCWCAPHNLFEPFNLTRWESKSSMSVIARRDFWGWLVDEPIELPKPPVTNQTNPPDAADPVADENAITIPVPSRQSRWATLQERVASYGRSRPSAHAAPKPDGTKTGPLATPTTATRTSESTATATATEKAASDSPSETPATLPWQYDLRPYGGGIILDFGWGRPKQSNGFNPEAHVFKPHRAQ